MRREKSFTIKIWLLVIIAVLASSVLICAAAIFQARSAIRNSTRQRMLDIANCAAGSVDGDILEMLTAEDENTPEYRKIYDALAVYRDNVELDYVYGIKDEGDGRFTFTVDPALIEPGEFGEEVVCTDALLNASRGIATVDEKPYHDAWGNFYSAYSPVFDSKGEVAGIIAADFSVEWYEGQQKDQIEKIIVLFLIILFLTLILAGIFCYVQAKSLTNPMAQMTEIAEQYGHGDFSGNLEVDRRDEIGVLSRSLQSMATSLKEQIEKEEAANRAKSDFLARMSHEIRTPINAILGMNEMILREGENTNILEYSKNVRAAGHTLLGLVNDVLDFSKIEAGKIEIIPVDYDMSSVLNDLVSVIHTRADDKGLMLTLDFDENIPRQLHGDEIRIKQIITNMLSNAVKYTERGGIVFHVGYETIKGDPDNIILEVAVTDTGIGIKPEDMDRLFTEFERLEVERNRHIEGTGLGMSIIKSLLEMMGSELEVESEYGRGSTFSFSLKQKVVKWDALGDYESTYRENLLANKKYKERFTAPDVKVLVVDDNPMNLMVFKSLVKQTRMRIDTATSGDRGLDFADNCKYDVIFLDHMMPKKDGIETLHELRQKSNCPNHSTPVICLTANAIFGAREEYITQGFNDYLSKPINTENLENMLLTYLPPDKIKPIEESFYEEEPNDKWDDSIKRLKACGEIDVETGIQNSGSVEFYMLMVKLFYESIEEKSNELDDFYQAQNISDYTIKVHALKSSARIIGAMDFGEEAQLLEDAGKRNDYDYIRVKHDAFMEKLRRYKTLLRDAVDMEEAVTDEKPKADATGISEAYQEIRAAAEDMDCDRLGSVFEKMEDYAIPTEEAELWNKLKMLSDLYDYESILDLIK